MKLGIALSGGGSRGIAHAGVLKALEDNNIKPDIIGGTSSGSIVASLYAIGYSPDEIYSLYKENASKLVEINKMPIIFTIGNFMRNKKIKISGLKTGESIEKVYNDIAYRKNIESMKDIKMPIVIPSVSLKDCKEYVFTNIIPEGKNKQYITDITVGKAVRASSSFTGVFCPCEYKEHLFIDGGALDNLPVHEVKKQGADKVLAVKFNADPITKDSNIMDMVMKTIDIMGNKVSEEGIELSDFVLTVPTDKTGLLDIKKADKCFEFGYNAVIQNLDKIKEILEIN